MSDSQAQRSLATDLRASASRAAELVGGGCALVFAEVPGDASKEASTRLRAASGFVSPDAAKNAATASLEAVRETIERGEADQKVSLPEMGDRGAAEAHFLPLVCEGRVRGVLVTGAPEKVDAAALESLRLQAELVSWRLDHSHLEAEIEPLRRDAADRQGEPHSDELLKLSEALFTQDIELLRSNEKLGKIEKLKNDFIEKMSRELRTPLNSIIEAIIGVLAGEHDSISDQSKASMRKALDEGTAFQRTLQNILDLWRIKQNELPVEIQEVNVAEVVQEAIFSVQDTVDEGRVEILKELGVGLPKVRTDVAKINQLLFLLLDNAVKFTPSGSITISAELVGDRLVCEVSDTGIGVCADDQEFIYDEFFQVDAHSSATYRGAGLGLSLVRDLIVLLDGEISFDSEAGKGTAVRFEIPVEPV